MATPLASALLLALGSGLVPQDEPDEPLLAQLGAAFGPGPRRPGQ